MLKYLVLIFLSLQINFDLQSQEDLLVGVINESLVSINPLTAETELIVTLNLPSNLVPNNLAYSPVDCLFYSTSNGDFPKLISFDWNGNVTVIGPLIFNNSSVYQCEALAFNEIENKFYGSINQDGSSFSPLFVEIDPSDGTSTLTSELTTSIGQVDIDNMTIHNNVLYFNDGIPGNSIHYFFEYDITNIGSTFSPPSIFNGQYIPIADLVYLDGVIFMPSSYNETNSPKEFYNYDIATQTLSFIGETHRIDEYGGQRMRGIEYVNKFKKYVLGIDTLICSNQEFVIDLNIEESSQIVWNTGIQGSKIIIEDAGEYWAEILIDNCILVRTDTIKIQFDELCIDCAGVLNGNSIMDECEECLEVDNPNFNQSCVDCLGVPNGNSIMDECGKCLEPNHSSFNSCFEITFPNAFSPNNDNINDDFMAFGDIDKLTKFEISIFNRWGQIIYFSNNPYDKWNGSFEGNFQPIGIYTYNGIYDFGNYSMEFMGNVTLIK